MGPAAKPNRSHLVRGGLDENDPSACCVAFEQLLSSENVFHRLFMVFHWPLVSARKNGLHFVGICRSIFNDHVA